MLFCIVIAICSAGCTDTTDPVRIGVLLPESGPLAMHSLDGLAWAVEAMNRQGGCTIELVYRDTSAGNTLAYAEELAGRDDIDIIIGPATSAELMQIAPLVTGKGKILISSSVTSGVVTAEYNGNDLLWRTPPMAGRWRHSFRSSGKTASTTSLSSPRTQPTERRLHGLPRQRPR
jgi:ABC-type branched-subunit amino acid transport system substrate-binding protein